MAAAKESGPMALTERLDPGGENTQKVNELLAQLDTLLNPAPASNGKAPPSGASKSSASPAPNTDANSR
jgi:hypothetical protein